MGIKEVIKELMQQYNKYKQRAEQQENFSEEAFHAWFTRQIMK